MVDTGDLTARRRFYPCAPARSAAQQPVGGSPESRDAREGTGGRVRGDRSGPDLVQRILQFQQGFLPNVRMVVLINSRRNFFQALAALGQNLQAVSMLSKAAALAGNDATVHRELESLQAENIVQQRAHQGCIFSWGVAQTGALGISSTRDCEMPTMIDALRGKHIVDASCGAMHSVAVTGVGEVYTWGSNKYGQTGHDNGKEQYNLPTIVPSLLGTFVTAVSCGSGHTVVTTRGGLVYSWGMGNQGQLGHGDAANVILPRQVLGLTGANVHAVATGIAHSLFLLADGAVVGCGMNSFGALGIDTKGEPILSPMSIYIDDGSDHKVEIVHIAAGGEFVIL